MMDHYLTTDEAAEAARMHPDTIRKALEAKTLHGLQRKKGAPWKIAPSCLEAFAAGEPCGHKSKSTSHLQAVS